jgi:uncharacterized membrane protein
MSLNLLMAFGTKAPCMASWPHGTSPRPCYSDVQALFVTRQLAEHVFPYIHGVYVTSATGSVFIGHGELEYPVLTGLFAWVAALPVSTHGGFFLANVLMLAPFGLASAWLLAKMCGRRALLFAAAPSVLLYGFINWDLFSVGLVLIGIYLWWRQHPLAAAVVFAVGGCAKLWPALFLLALIADALSKGDRQQALRAGAIAAGVAAVVNIPFAVVNPRGWVAPFAFQAAARIDAPGSTIWDWDAHFLNTQAVTALSWVFTGVGVIALLAVGWRRSRQEGAFPFVQTGAAMVFWYVAVAKDNSPQYVLWLLPFFVLLRLKPQHWVQLMAINVAMYLFFLYLLNTPELYILGAWQTAVFVVCMVDAARAKCVLVEAREVPGGARAGGASAPTLVAA